MDDFPTKTIIYKGFSMAMLNNQQLIECSNPAQLNSGVSRNPVPRNPDLPRIGGLSKHEHANH
jgi:hypothetical protein